MSGAIPPLPQYAFMAWYLVKSQEHLLMGFDVYVHIKESILISKT